MRKKLENQLKNKKTVIILITFFCVTLIGLSFAYFVAQISSPANTDVNVGTGVLEKLIFTPGEDLSIFATTGNFADGDGSLSDVTTSSATLIASSDSNNAIDKYQIYFNVASNNFEYTVNSDTPELLLKITDPEGNIITSLEGFNYKTVTDYATGENLSGFDITNFEGLIRIKEDHVINSTNSDIGFKQDWTIEVTFVNLNFDQTANEGKNLDATLILQKEKLINPAEPYSCYDNLDTTSLPDPETVYDYYLDHYNEIAVIVELDYNNYNPSELIVPCFIEEYQVDRIEATAFGYGLDATKMYLPEGLTVLDSDSISIFGLVDIVLPYSLEYIHYDAIDSAAISEDENKFVKSSNEGAIWVLAYRNSVQDGNVVIPEGVVGIANTGLSYYRASSINLPNSLKYIGDYAFNGTSLTEFVVPSSVVNVGHAVVNLPYNSDGISLSSDEGAVWLIGTEHGNITTELVLPSNVIGIADYGLTDNDDIYSSVVTGFNNVSLPDGLLYLGRGALANNNLVSIDIPDSVISIGDGVLSNNNFPDESAYFYNRNSDGSIDYESLNSYAGSSVSNLVIPSTIKYVGNRSFYNGFTDNFSINGINLSFTESIGVEAFRYNLNIDLIGEISPALKTIHSYAFADISKYETYHRNEYGLLPTTVTDFGSYVFFYPWGG